jgi:hypothetical protein
MASSSVVLPSAGGPNRAGRSPGVSALRHIVNSRRSTCDFLAQMALRAV